MYILLLILAYIILTRMMVRPRAQADADQASIQGFGIVSPPI
jgi:hypothetical protein